ncbi:MAG: hypothetical protein HXX16_08240 [Bacteroidales bacterium]|nr:hypothetical protein [Bacteroidales bacterium]
MSVMFGPRLIRTLDLEKDIYQFYCSDLTRDKFQDVLKLVEPDNMKKLQKITERMEFVHHLLAIREILITHKTSEFKFFEEPQALIGITKIDHIRLFDKNFDGVDYDIEALVLYLLLTCIDTIAGQDEYKSFSEWIQSNWENFKSEKIDNTWIKRKEDEHKAIFGVGKNFKNLISNEISEELKIRAINNFAVTKLDNGKVNQESWTSWELASSDEKIKKIAKNLFEQIRNKYTHSNYRTFFPHVNIKYLRQTDFPVLISIVEKEDDADSLVRLLIDIVTYFVSIKLLKIK